MRTAAIEAYARVAMATESLESRRSRMSANIPSTDMENMIAATRYAGVPDTNIEEVARFDEVVNPASATIMEPAIRPRRMSAATATCAPGVSGAGGVMRSNVTDETRAGERGMNPSELREMLSGKGWIKGLALHFTFYGGSIN